MADRSLGKPVWHVTVLVPAILALLCGLWGYALRPPSIPEAFAPALWVKTDPPSPVSLTLDPPKRLRASRCPRRPEACW
jgi:hypothetical protein